MQVVRRRHRFPLVLVSPKRMLELGGGNGLVVWMMTVMMVGFPVVALATIESEGSGFKCVVGWGIGRSALIGRRKGSNGLERVNRDGIGVWIEREEGRL